MDFDNDASFQRLGKMKQYNCDDVDWTPITCCVFCNYDVYANRFDCPVCQKQQVETDIYFGVWESDDTFTCCDCGSIFKWVEKGKIFEQTLLVEAKYMKTPPLPSPSNSFFNAKGTYRNKELT